LVGPETADDAGVFRIGERLALVESADIITPLVDDPFTFGRIAAANALSDVYAMGGKPLTAINLAFFPACDLPMDILREVLAGGASLLAEAGVALVGGHTVEDSEFKYGLSVTGTIDPDRIIRNSTASPGDRLLLTKPLGTGIITTAIKAEMASPESVAEAVRWMTTLNAKAASLMLECNASAATDVTGFGLVGHACEMAIGAGVTFLLGYEAIPAMTGVAPLIMEGMVPAGCYRNRDYYQARLLDARGDNPLTDELLPLFDPQTSGGLLIALKPDDADIFLEKAGENGIHAWLVGEVVARREKEIVIA
jgi:selenide,water dikinase